MAKEEFDSSLDRKISEIRKFRRELGEKSRNSLNNQVDALKKKIGGLGKYSGKPKIQHIATKKKKINLIKSKPRFTPEKIKKETTAKIRQTSAVRKKSCISNIKSAEKTRLPEDDLKIPFKFKREEARIRKKIQEIAEEERMMRSDEL